MTKYFKDPDNITQGAILKDFIIFSMNEDGAIKEIKLPYCVIISQACDIKQSSNGNAFLPNIMILPLYILEVFKEGNHLKKCGYEDVGQRIFKEGRESEKLKGNEEFPRYFFLSKEEGLLEHDVVADFKHYYTIPKSLVINQFSVQYVATINYLHRELLSQRFCNYLGRIGLPE